LRAVRIFSHQDTEVNKNFLSHPEETSEQCRLKDDECHPFGLSGGQISQGDKEILRLAGRVPGSE
jgi:hypothetical protein